MKDSYHYTDSLLNSYLDGELDAEETQQLLEALQTDTALNQRLNQLSYVRNMMRLSYHDITDPKIINPETRTIRLRRFAYAAALATLVIGITIGWIVHNYTERDQKLFSIAQQLQLNNKISAEDNWRILLHLTTDDPRRLQVVLDETESLLKQYKQAGHALQIEILANEQGLNLLRTDTSAYSQRIHEMQKRYNNLMFIACGTALQNLHQKKQSVQLLPEVQITPTALGEIMRKQSQGWAYIKI